MNKKLPTKHRNTLQQLNLEFRTNSEGLAREARWEEFFVIVGAIGAIVVIIGIIDPSMTKTSAGISLFGLSGVCTLLGAWSYFAPPSEKKDRASNIILDKVKKELEEYRI